MPAKILNEVLPPDDLAVGNLQARQVSAHAEHIQPVSVDGWRASWSLFRLRHALLNRGSQRRRPEFLAIGFRKRPHHFLVVTVPHAENAPLGNRRSAVAAT